MYQDLKLSQLLEDVFSAISHKIEDVLGKSNIKISTTPPRIVEDIMDLVISGGERIVVREGFNRNDLDRVFENVDVEIYLSVSKDSDLKDYQGWDGFVYLLDKRMDFEIEEMLTNLARHADFENRTPDVSLDLDSREEALLLTFKDNAESFNLLDHPDPKIGGELEEAELGGLGVYLTKQYAKEIQYGQENGYNILKIFL